MPPPLAGKRSNFVDRIAQTPLRHFCEEMAVLARLWQMTGRAEYAEEACQRLTALLDVWELQHQPGKPWKRVCFFSAYPIIDAYRLLRAGGQLDEEFQRRFRRFAREAYFAQEEGTFNQAFARAAGAGLGRQDPAGTARGRRLAQVGRGGLEPMAPTGRHDGKRRRLQRHRPDVPVPAGRRPGPQRPVPGPGHAAHVRPFPRPGQPLGRHARIRRLRRRQVGHVSCLGHLGMRFGAGGGLVPRSRLSLGRRADVPGGLPERPQLAAGPRSVFRRPAARQAGRKAKTSARRPRFASRRWTPTPSAWPINGATAACTSAPRRGQRRRLSPRAGQPIGGRQVDPGPVATAGGAVRRWPNSSPAGSMPTTISWARSSTTNTRDVPLLHGLGYHNRARRTGQLALALSGRRALSA